jgi:hypothetical protein
LETLRRAVRPARLVQERRDPVADAAETPGERAAEPEAAREP